jgi:ectoine hydroxylase-related dioxygenase (phytanoyl-CoA dioxygenase family)
MFAAQLGREDGNQFDLAGADDDKQTAALPQILFPDRYEPRLRGVFFELAAGLARQLLGPEADVRIFHAILKPARHGAPTPWHQDEAYWDPALQYRSLSMWMPLQEATIENGCMWFASGSHEWDVLPHQSIGGDRRVHGLELVDPSVVKDKVACPIPAGGLTIHRNRTLHFAGPNATDGPRRALIMEASLPAQPRVGERRFLWREARETPRAERARLAGEPVDV